MLTKLPDFPVNTQKIIQECIDIADNYEFGKHNQISLMHSIDCKEEDKLQEGCGSWSVLPPEITFSEYNKLLNMPEIINLFECVNVYLNKKIYRARLMLVKGKQCYTLHKDLTLRFHFPVVTNEGAMFLFPDQQKFYHLELGHSYIVDTTKRHSFANMSFESRLHLVGSII